MFVVIKNMLRPGAVLAVLFLAVGCAIPMDTKPKALTEPAVAELAADLSPAGVARGWPDPDWWRAYNDPQLNRLMDLALAGSPSLDVAAQRVDLAQAQAELAWTNQLPIIGAMGGIDRQRVSGEGFLSLFAEDMPLLGIKGPWYTAGTTGFVASWDLDVWGRHRDQLRAAVGAARAARAEEAQARLSISAAVARTYWGMQTLLAMKDILAEARGIEALAYEAEKARFERGLASSLEADLARVRVDKLDEQLALVDGGFLVLREGFKALLGLETALPEIKRGRLPEPVNRLPERLGYELLVRRPDLQAARWYIEASLGAVDAARAAFYPSFDLKAFFGFDAIHIDKLFTGNAAQINTILGVSLPIFDGGRLNANLKIMRAESDLGILRYNEAVAGAVSEVARAAVQMQSLERQNKSRKKALAGLTRAYEAAQAQYKTGLGDRVTAARAKLPLLADKSQAAELRGRWLSAELDLITALGGGYRAKPFSDDPANEAGPADPFLEKKIPMKKKKGY